MQIEQGDLIDKARAGEFDVIVHGCNCFCTMGAGIAKTIKQVFPTAYQADKATSLGDKAKLGQYFSAQVEVNGKPLVIINGYTQFDWRGPGCKADYDAIRRVFRQANWISGYRRRLGWWQLDYHFRYYQRRISWRRPRICRVEKVAAR